MICVCGNTSLVVGANSGKTLQLDEELTVGNYREDGSCDEHRQSGVS